jgi:hypothetical protein
MQPSGRAARGQDSEYPTLEASEIRSTHMPWDYLKTLIHVALDVAAVHVLGL